MKRFLPDAWNRKEIYPGRNQGDHEWQRNQKICPGIPKDRSDRSASGTGVDEGRSLWNVLRDRTLQDRYDKSCLYIMIR